MLLHLSLLLMRKGRNKFVRIQKPGKKQKALTIFSM